MLSFARTMFARTYIERDGFRHLPLLMNFLLVVVASLNKWINKKRKQSFVSQCRFVCFVSTYTLWKVSNRKVFVISIIANIIDMMDSNLSCVRLKINYILFAFSLFLLGYYIFHTYIPTCLIVIISWISFWIKPEAVPARVTLCVTSLLTLSTQHAQSQKNLPPWVSRLLIDIIISLFFSHPHVYMSTVSLT